MICVSIITINLNNSAGLVKTIKSVVEQTVFGSFEFIIIDGASTDDSVKVIESYKEKINYYISEADKGIYDAMNKGVKLSNGKYLLFLNSGDELANEEVISKITKKININYDIIYGNMIVVNNDLTSYLGTMPEKLTFEHMMNDTLWHPVSFISRTLFLKVGFYDTNYKIVADYDWFLKAIFKYNAKLFHANLTISKFYLDGLSSLDKNAHTIKIERKKSQLALFGEEIVKNFEISNEKNQKNSNNELNFFKRLLKFFYAKG